MKPSTQKLLERVRSGEPNEDGMEVHRVKLFKLSVADLKDAIAVDPETDFAKAQTKGIKSLPDDCMVHVHKLQLHAQLEGKVCKSVKTKCPETGRVTITEEIVDKPPEPSRSSRPSQGTGKDDDGKKKN